MFYLQLELNTPSDFFCLRVKPTYDNKVDLIIASPLF